ncbi:FecCD family ABC transporter permease [Desulfonauticus submarinus]
MARKIISNKQVFYILLLFCSCLLFILSLWAGPVSIPLNYLFTSANSTGHLILMDIRLPRTILAYLIGVALSSSGATLQAILNNPLAEPFTLGISSGAAFMACLGLFFGFNMFSIYSLPIMSLFGALITLIFVLYLASYQGEFRTETLILAGIVLTTFFSALISILKSLDEESVSSIVFWLMGSFAGRSWEELKIFFPFFIFGFSLLLFFRKHLDILTLGDIEANNLGLNPHLFRMLFFVLTSFLAGASVSVAGVIGFIGLVSPHLLRLLKIESYVDLLPLSALLGGCLTLGADILARIILSGGEELPVGSLTALLGGPFFCVLLLKNKKQF